MVDYIPNSIPKEYIDYLISLPEVKEAKERIDAQSEGKVYFTVSLTPDIKTTLHKTLGIDLTPIDSVPMRWIKGDTLPHIDTGVRTFQKTHLVYLTDSEGEFLIDGQKYPITQGCGYSFSEGLRHETVGTGQEPRLLLGPMSEQGFAVGVSGTSISADGGKTIYIQQTTPGGTVQYIVDSGSPSDISLYPIIINNTNTSFGVVKVEFLTDITFDRSTGNTDAYFDCGTSYIQFGSTSLKIDGTRPLITISNITNYPGLIKNLNSNPTNSNSNIYVYNLVVDGTNSTLIDGGGWIGQAYFGRGTVENYIVNCSSSGDISNTSGGIVGKFAGGSFGQLVIIGCSSSGIIGNNCGGIVGIAAGSNNGYVKCKQCWSIGNIQNRAGGIYGMSAGVSNATVVAEMCYSEGNQIGSDAGGIYGRSSSPGSSSIAIATNCYSKGSINANGGGIFGSNSGSESGNFAGTTQTINCYTLGNIIYGPFNKNSTRVSCYIANNLWVDTNAISSLQLNTTPIPPAKVGTVWISRGTNEPYELNGMGYTPYSLIVINPLTNDLVQQYSQTIQAGQTTVSAIVSGKSYEILQINGGSSAGTITIDSSSGAISTTPATPPGTYTIYVRNTGSYNITTFELTVTEPETTQLAIIPLCCEPTCPQFNQTTNNTQELVSVKHASKAIASDVDSTYLAINQNRGANFAQPAFKSYRDYMIYLQSKYK